MDWPGVSCEACRDMWDVDRALPDCYNGSCRIPEIDAQGEKVLHIRGKILALQGLVDSGTVLKMYGATKEDIDLLAEVETEITELQRNQIGGADNG